jgi:hypothetical protein
MIEKWKTLKQKHEEDLQHNAVKFNQILHLYDMTV